MSFWVDRILPHLVERALSTGDVMKQRQIVCGHLSGKVLEIGFGSGLNIVKYPQSVESVAAVEPSDVAWEMSAKRRTQSAIPITRSGLDGQVIDEPGSSFDAVLSTFTLCTIPDAEQALREVHRVLRPGGMLVFLEHGLAPEPGVVRWQRRMEPMQKLTAGGCHLTRDVPALVSAADFTIATLDQRYLPGPRISRPWAYAYAGSAIRG